MKIGFIGTQGAGRSTLFSAVTGRNISARATPGKTQLGIARIMDQRVDRLTEICKPKRTVHAEVVVSLPPPAPAGPVDIAALREMRDLGALAHVIGAFDGDPPERVVPPRITELTTELILADLDRVETRLTRIGKGGHARTREDELLARARACLDAERPLRLERCDEQLTALMDELGLTSHRPLITLVNVAEDQLRGGCPPAVIEATAAVGSEPMWLCATLEAEIAALEPQEQQEFLVAYGLSRPVSQRFVQAAFSLLNQISFFTIGPDEVRAWPIASGSNARRAARTIHTDLERGFIRAEVVTYDLLLEHGNEARCRAVGVMRTEGKDYEVQDGDIITVRFNV